MNDNFKYIAAVHTRPNSADPKFIGTNVMNNLNIEKQAKKLIAYSKQIKHPDTFKYVKGLSKNQRLLLSILCFRAKNGEYSVRLSNSELEAFGMKIAEGHEGLEIVGTTTISGKPTIVPLRFF